MAGNADVTPYNEIKHFGLSEAGISMTIPRLDQMDVLAATSKTSLSLPRQRYPNTNEANKANTTLFNP
jgi:hypothetical protein